jgi:hypothetical protein
MGRLWYGFNAIVQAITAVLFLAEANSVVAQEPQTPQVFAGVICDSFATSDLIDLIVGLESRFGCPPNELGEEIRDSIHKRFADRITVPYAKGCVLVSHGESIEYWYCEECFTLEGARALVDDFSKMWRSSEETKRPNYLVEMENPVKDQWSLNVSYLSWSSSIVESTPEEKARTGEDFKTVWTSKKSSFARKHRFRYQNGWLWSAYSDSLFAPSGLPDIAEHSSQTNATSKRLGKAWFSPQKLSAATRAYWDTAISTAVGTVAQQDDDQSAQQAMSNKGLHDACLAIVRAILNDTELASAELFVNEKQLVLDGRISIRADSQAAQYLQRAELPRTPVPPPSSGMSFVAATRLPSSVLSAFDHQDADHDHEIDLVCVGEFIGDAPDALYGSISITGVQPARMFRILGSLAPVLTLAEPISLRGIPITFTMSEDSKESALEIAVMGHSAKDSPRPSTPVVEYRGRGSILAFRISESVLGSSEWLLQPTAQPSEDKENRPSIEGDFSADRQGLSARITCSLPAAERILASLILLRQKSAP